MAREDIGRHRLLISVTVPETIAFILESQPRFLNASGFEVALVCSSGNLVESVGSSEQVPVLIVPMVRGISLLRDFLAIILMIGCILRLKPDIVHSYTPKAGLVSMLASWVCRVPIRVHTFTGLIFPTSIGLRRILLIWADKLICACATHVVPEGSGVKRDLEQFRITRKPMNVIGYGNIAGIDITHFSPEALGIGQAGLELRRKLGIRTDEFVFCFVGRLNKDKGLAELMQAFVGLPLAVHLVLVGWVDQSGPVGADVLAAVKAHPRVHALGFVNDVRPALLAADVLVLPSYREGFPNVVLQAGAMALPVIATDINGCNEVIEPGFNGWLVPPRDSMALEHAMRAAMHTPTDELREMGYRSRFRIQKRFERHQHWERMLAFYKGLLVSHNKS